MGSYTIASQEGADLHAQRKGEAAEVGDTVELTLTADEERAVVAAGWLTPNEKPKEAKK